MKTSPISTHNSKKIRQNTPKSSQGSRGEGVVIQGEKMKGYIHSKESFGTLDGPGIRYVLFMQGCPMRCLYCHNPDTWEIGCGKEIDAEEVIEEFTSNEAFYRGGGITVSGGEPLLQIDFITELFKLAKEKGIHTCIDTSGITFAEKSPSVVEKFDTLMNYTDLVMLDIKHIAPSAHKTLTGHTNENTLALARYLFEKNVSVWVRYVLLPGYTDGEDAILKLADFIAPLKNVRAIEVLPYHTMGVAKYRELNIPYPLEGVKTPTKAEADAARAALVSRIKQKRSGVL